MEKKQIVISEETAIEVCEVLLGILDEVFPDGKYVPTQVTLHPEYAKKFYDLLMGSKK